RPAHGNARARDCRRRHALGAAHFGGSAAPRLFPRSETAMTRFSACILALAACQHWHYERNAPGHIDVTAPPTSPTEEPGDPGEHMIVVSPGAFAGGGSGFGGDGGSRARASAGVLASIEYGWSPRSHVEDELFGVVPFDSIGLAVGWNAYENDQ